MIPVTHTLVCLLHTLLRTIYRKFTETTSIIMATTPGRSRRATAKVVNYAKEQEFSDAEDLFESEPEDEPAVVATTARRKRAYAPRKSSAAAEPETMAAADDFNHRPTYTEKGYDPSLPPLRERFAFLAEYEDDGSPKVELIVGRRPIDEKEDVVEEDDDAENAEAIEDEEEAKTPKKRTRTGRGAAKVEPTPTSSGRSKPGDTPDSKKKKGDASPGDEIVEYEYLVKYKGKSYLHLEWKTGADLESMNRSAKGIYRRYLKKLAAGTDEDLENPEVDPSYVIPEKILDEADQEIAVDLTDKELLKWEKEREKEKGEEGDDDEDDNKTPAKQNGGFSKLDEEKKGAFELAC